MHVSLWNVALQTVNFVVLAWLLERFLFKPVRAVLARRQQTIESAMREADARKAEADRTIGEYGARLADIEREADHACRKALDAAAQDAQRLRNEAIREGKAAIEQASRELQREREEALRDIEQRTADLTMAIAERLLREAARPDADAPFLWHLSASIDSLDESRKIALAKELRERGADVVSAHPLDGATRERLGQWLDALAGASVRASYTVDPNLLAGVELRLPTSVWRSHWRDSLDRVRAELGSHGVAA